LDIAGNGSVGQAINNSGAVIGYSYTDANDMGNCQHAFVWQDGHAAYLDAFGGSFSRPFGINDSGLIIGVADDPDGNRHAVLWQPIPEPSSLLALAGGMGCAAAMVRRRRRRC
jgi:probable HAF family extracellular repeat protein